MNRTIPEVLKPKASQWLDRPALQLYSLTSGLLTLTYKEILAKVELATTALKQAGLNRGDRVVLLSENHPEWVITFLAILNTEMTVVPLDPALMPSDLSELIQFADPRAIVASGQQREKLSANFGLPILDIHSALVPFENSLATVPLNVVPTPDPDSSIAVIIFTSGTTGRPKGVMLDHESLLHSANCGVEQLPTYDEPHRILNILPLHHIAALTCNGLMALMMGATVTFLDVVSSDRILAAMQATQPTILPAVPRLYELFYSEICRQVQQKGAIAQTLFHLLGVVSEKAQSWISWNLGRFFFRKVHQTFGGNLAVCLCGAAPLSLEVERGWERLGFTLLKGYGLTESGVAVYNTLAQKRFGHVGQPLKNVEIQIAQASAATGEGEVCLRGATLMRSYFRDPEATREVMRDHWLHTGDLGKLDAEGNLIITGRIKELIVTSGGKKAAPSTIEQYYQNLPGVKELAVVGIAASGSLGDQIYAAVVLNPATVLKSVEQAIQSCAETVPAYLRIQKVVVVESIPKTSTLKVRRLQLRDLLLADLGRINPLPQVKVDDPLSQQVLELVRRIVRETPHHITLRSTLQFDLAIDSLNLIELASQIEKAFGTCLTEQQFAQIYTIEDLVNFIRIAEPSDVKLQKPIKSIPIPRGFWQHLALTVFSSCARLIWQIEVSGIEHLPTTGGFILCPNHESHFDVFWVAACLPKQMQQQLCCFAKREHFESPVMQRIVQLVGAIPVDREGDILPALQAGREVLQHNYPLLIHPEGTRSRTGKLLPFRRGAAKLAIETDSPLVPVRIIGAYQIYPSHQKLPRFFNWRKLQRLKLQICFAPAIMPNQSGELAEVELTQQVQAAVSQLGT